MKARPRPGFSILGPGVSDFQGPTFQFRRAVPPGFPGAARSGGLPRDAGQVPTQPRFTIGTLVAANSTGSGPGRSDPRDPPCGLRQLDVDRGKPAGAILSAQGAELSPDSAFKPTLPKYHIENSGLEEVTEHNQIAG